MGSIAGPQLVVAWTLAHLSEPPTTFVGQCLAAPHLPCRSRRSGHRAVAARVLSSPTPSMSVQSFCGTWQLL